MKFAPTPKPGALATPGFLTLRPAATMDHAIAKLALEDGTIFTGQAFGARGETFGEVVFNTSMTGYQEVLTDPSYKGQIVTMTYPLIGNYGINTEDVESRRIQVEGFIVRELTRVPSNFRSHGTLEDYLVANNVLGLEGIDLGAEVGGLDLAVKQKIEIARALFRQPRILLLDEPTSSLSGSDVDWLGEIIAREKARGVTVIFISHRLKEVRDFCDSLTVLRNGQHIVTGKVADFVDEEVIRMIVGRSIGQAFPAKPARTHGVGPEVLRVDRLATDGKLADASFALHRGEILGVAGLQGMGQLDLFVACFGAAEITRGQIAVDGKPVTIATPADAVRADIGISLVPEDRKTEALFLKLSGTENASIPVIDRFARFGFIDVARERAAVSGVFRRLDVPERALWTRAGAFSGGNQQKIAVAKWLLAESRILLLYDPTRGIDVGTKHELYQLMREYVAAGGSILLYSTEIPELVHLADRVLVLYQGRVVREIEGESLSEDRIMRAALGHGEAEHAA